MEFHSASNGNESLYSPLNWSNLYVQNIVNVETAHGSLETLLVHIFLTAGAEFLNVPNLKYAIVKIKEKYNPNPYHNFEHACHVVLNCGYLLYVLGESVSPLDKISLLYSGLIHDVEHLGVPNISLIRKSHDLAVLYHDQSVAEMNSLAIGLNLLQQTESDIIVDLPKTERFQFRQNVIELVLSTDIADAYRRKRTFVRIEELSTGPQGALNISTDAGKLVLLSILMRLADIGSSYQNFTTSITWARRYYTETNAWLLSEGKPIFTHEFFFKDQIIHLENYVGSIVEWVKKTQCLDAAFIATLETNFQANVTGWKSQGDSLLDEWEKDFRIAYKVDEA